MNGIRARLLLLVGFTTAPLFLFLVHQGLEERRRARAREWVEAHRLARLFAVEHARAVGDARQLLLVLAQGPALRRGDAAVSAAVLRRIRAESPHYEGLLMVDSDGAVIATPGAGDLATEGRALLETADSAPFAVGPIRRGSVAPFPSLTVAHAVPSAPRATRLVARLSMSWIVRHAAAADLDPLTTVTLWDSSGRILLSYPDSEGYVGRDASHTELWRVMQRSGGEGSAEAVGGDGVPSLFGFTRLEPGGAFLSLGIPTHVAFAELRRLERRNLVVLVLVTALAAGIATFAAERVVRLFGRLQRFAERDPLTGLVNRRRLLEIGEEELRRARRFGHPLAALMIDLDHFKQVNDRLGHGTGDEVLREVARRVQLAVRGTDVPARYGGEEFAVLLPETALQTAVEAAERIRSVVAAAPAQTRRGPVVVTLSAGAAVLTDPTHSLRQLLGDADAALYAAKRAGRNRVSVGPPACVAND